jgi:hypothetical protein
MNMLLGLQGAFEPKREEIAIFLWKHKGLFGNPFNG